jgi:hypothetical protein
MDFMDLRLKVFYGVSKNRNEVSREEEVECRIAASSRVESWRSGYVLYLQLPLIKPYVRFSRIRLSDHLHPEALANHAWPSGIVSSEVPGLLWSSQPPRQSPSFPSSETR